jgi:Uma2 family endonuclease
LRDNVLILAPEICVEVLSPGHTRDDMEEKRALLFESGAEEVWFCDGKGRVTFFLREPPGKSVVRSALCPAFPDEIA